MKKIFIYLLLAVFCIGSAFAVPFKPNSDEIIFGRGGNTIDKTMTFDVGDGAGNPRLLIDDILKVFDFNKDLSVTGGVTATGNIQGADGTFSGVLDINGDSVTIGDGTNSNKFQTFDIGAGGSNPYIGWSSSANSLVFNNGVTEKKIGSGTGGGAGGINLLANSSFEDAGSPILNWTNSGGNFSQESLTNSREGNLAFAQLIATTSGQYFESDTVTISDDIGFGCMADIYYKDGDNQFEYQVLKETSPSVFEVVARQDFGDNTNTTFLKAPAVTFDCESGDVFKFRVESKNAGTIGADVAYLGSNKNIAPIGKGASFVGSIEWAPTANCIWSAPNTSFVDFQSNSNCDDNPRTTVGEAIDSSAGLLPEFQANLKKGHYKLVVTGFFGDTTGATNSEQYWRAIINSQPTQSSASWHQSGAGANPTLEFSFDIAADASNALIKMQGAAFQGASDPARMVAVENNFKMALYYFPTSQETEPAFSPEQAEFFIDASISGGLSDTLGNSTGSISNSVTSSNWTLTTNKGTAFIPCTSETSSGSTCPSSQEVLGISFFAPVAGLYEVCGNFTIRQNAQDGGVQNNDTTFRWEQTVNDSFTTIQKGTARHAFSRESTGVVSGLQKLEIPGRFCETFNISSIGLKTFKFKYLQTVNTTSVVINAQSQSTENAANIKVRLLKNDVATPRLLNQISTRARYGAEKGACHVTNTGTASFDSSDPDCWMISSLNTVSAGQVEIYFTEPGLKCSWSPIDTNLPTWTVRQTAANGSGSITTPSLPSEVTMVSQNQTGSTQQTMSFSMLCSKNK